MVLIKGNFSSKLSDVETSVKMLRSELNSSKDAQAEHKEGKQVTSQIHKLLESSTIPIWFSAPYPKPGQFPWHYATSSAQFPPSSRPLGGRRHQPTCSKCFHCRKPGQFIRNCPDLNGFGQDSKSSRHLSTQYSYHCLLRCFICDVLKMVE